MSAAVRGAASPSPSMAVTKADPARAAADIPALYERHAGAFGATRDRSLFERAWLDRLLGFLPDSASVLDLGCGMGAPIGGYMLSKGARLTGIDASPSLIACARAAYPSADWRVGDMRNIDPGGPFGAVIAWNSLFHLTPSDQTTLIPRMAGWLNPGGLLLFTAGPKAGERIGCFEGDALYHASLAPDDYRTLLSDHGLTVLDYRAEDPTCGGLTIWMAQRAE